MQVIYIHWEGNEYQVIRVAEQAPAELVFCDSSEELGVVLRGLGVAQLDVSRIFLQLEGSSDAVLRV